MEIHGEAVATRAYSAPFFPTASGLGFELASERYRINIFNSGTHESVAAFSGRKLVITLKAYAFR
ncbi:hypothetical protein [Azospirillum doebereinerae]